MTLDLRRTCTGPANKSPPYIQTMRRDPSRTASTGLLARRLPIRPSFTWSPSAPSAPEADLELLREHDDRAYEEALASGGLLSYFKGHANERGECLSFCLWETREQARRAADAASHRSAAAVSAQMYLSYVLERYWLTNVEDKLVFERI